MLDVANTQLFLGLRPCSSSWFLGSNTLGGLDCALKPVLLSHFPHVDGKIFELEIPISVVVVAEVLGKDDKLSRNLVSASNEWLARYIHPMMRCGA
jgi:hypothetical protein